MVKIEQVKVEKFEQGKNTCVKYMELHFHWSITGVIPQQDLSNGAASAGDDSLPLC